MKEIKKFKFPVEKSVGKGYAVVMYGCESWTLQKAER